MTYETQAISAMAASSDGQEGIAAFLGKPSCSLAW